MTQNQSISIKENFKANGHFMAFPIWTYLNHGECGIPWQGLVSRKRQGGLEHLQVPGTKFLRKDKDLHQAARRSAPAPFVEPSSIIFLKFLKPNFLPCNRRELEHWGYRASHAAPSFAHRWRLRQRPGISESEFEKNKSNLKELEGTKKRRKGRRHQALSPSKNIISGAVSSTESRHSSSVHPHVWFLNHFEGPVSCPFMPRKVKTCAIPILQYWSSMHCMQCLLHFDNIMLTLCLHCDYLGMMVPRCCLSSERSRCIDCMSLSTCPSMCPHWEDSCSSAAVHRFDQATESSESTVISASAKIVLFLKCDWRVDGTVLLKSVFVWIRPLRILNEVMILWNHMPNIIFSNQPRPITGLRPIRKTSKSYWSLNWTIAKALASQVRLSFNHLT